MKGVLALDKMLQSYALILGNYIRQITTFYWLSSSTKSIVLYCSFFSSPFVPILTSKLHSAIPATYLKVIKIVYWTIQ